MDLHKPKPWHNVREFLKEYVIIVIGVLTALAAESGVEWLHWRHVAERAEADLRWGVSADVYNALIVTATRPCATQRTLELAKALNAGEGSWKGTTVAVMTRVKPVLPEAMRELKGNYARSGWDTAAAEGVVPHLPAAEAQLFARAYGAAARIEEMQTAEAELEPRLSLLAYDRTLSREQRDGFLTILSSLDSTRARIDDMNQRLLDIGVQLKVKPLPGLQDNIERLRARRGPCVRDVPYPVK